MKRFYMVWKMDGGMPTFRHDTRRGALTEAERLAKANPGHRFVVLQSLCDFETNASVYTRHLSESDLPF